MDGVRYKLDRIFQRLDARKSQERVFSTLYCHSASMEADAADLRHSKGELSGPLDGRILSVKDLFDVAGEPTLAGSIIKRSATPAATDATIIKRLRQAGAVIIGKTHMTEFAFTALGLNPHYGIPGNALDQTRVPGGSSSGAAVSVAEGTSEIAIGSDTGGSVRIPAALNGLVGFKPTARRIPLDGAFPLSPTLDSIGPLAKTVADCILADAIMASDHHTSVAPLPLQNLRLLVPAGRLMSDLAPEIIAAFDECLRRCKTAGAQIITLEIDDLLQRMRQATKIGSIAAIEASRIHADWLDDNNADVDFRVRDTLLKRRLVSKAAYENLIAERNRLVTAMDQRLRPSDFLVMPTVPVLAPTIASISNNEPEYRRIEDLLLRNTQIANQFDLCSISLPMPTSPLATGFMLTGRHCSDKALLGVALTLESLFA